MKTIRVVLDTNVVVSAHLNPDGYERYVLDLALTHKLQLVVSGPILDEYEGVLSRPKFAIGRQQVNRSLRLIREAAKIIHHLPKLKVARDLADNRFVECAEGGKAEYLVTGNKRHFPKQWRQTLIVNARELLEWIVPELQR